ncbi:6-phosphofructokinase [candidate division NPL-UPA2 bacterium]|nr:6-phosphofructokinase [candidate division NPL-UPA2 bacterium]
MKKIGVLTSGGDCPGMNACIRAVVRTAIYHRWKVAGIKSGFAGLIDGEVFDMDVSSVSNIINLGGTILKSARSLEFKTRKGQARAHRVIKKAGLGGMVVIGGDGSLRGARKLAKTWKVPTVGVPASIDNDISGTDYSIGFDTAVNTALEAIDRIRDTATSHDRLFIIEVMGRECGFIALYAGLAGGAEDILLPETATDLEDICRKLEQGRKRGKSSSIIIVAEGDEAGGAFKISKEIEQRTGYHVRVTVLGHLQRGGSPTARDRILASRLGAAAVEMLIKGKHNLMVGVVSNRIKTYPLEHAWKCKKKIDRSLYKLTQILAI